MKKLIYFLVVMAFAVYFSKFGSTQIKAIAAEHPGEHPGEEVTKEHPGKEHPWEAISASEIRKAIESYIKNDSNLKGGYFLLYDPKDKQVLQLNFVRVHDRVSVIKKENAHFACSDFKTADGKSTYDLDFWMKKDKHGELDVYKVVVHKKDGKERFTYKDDEMVPVESEKMAPEEHT
jgi:hypothetical protein